MANRQVPEAVTAHQGHAGLEGLPCAHGQGIVGHHLGKTRRSWILALGNDPAHEISLRENSDQLTAVYDRNRANVAFDHCAYGLKNGVAKFRMIGLLIFDQVADTHEIPPGSLNSELAQGIYRGVSI